MAFLLMPCAMQPSVEVLEDIGGGRIDRGQDPSRGPGGFWGSEYRWSRADRSDQGYEQRDYHCPARWVVSKVAPRPQSSPVSQMGEHGRRSTSGAGKSSVLRTQPAASDAQSRHFRCDIARAHMQGKRLVLTQACHEERRCRQPMVDPSQGVPDLDEICRGRHPHPSAMRCAPEHGCALKRS